MKTFATVCSGIGAPEVACAGLGWECVFSSEIEPFPNAVRAHHFPAVPNYGDMLKFKDWPLHNEKNTEASGRTGVDVLFAGTPCQSFSVAGLRAGLADPRGNLTLTFLGIVERYAPRWVLWENVPGILSDKSGAFGSFINGLRELGYGVAYAILDAQYFGVAQRRRRVFVVGHSGGLWQRAAAVLFDRESMCWNPAPGREARESLTHSLAPSIGASGRGFERAGETRGQDPVIAEVCATITKNYAPHPGRTAGNNGGVAEGQVIAFAQNTRDEVREIGNKISGAIQAQPGMKQQTYIAQTLNVNRSSNSVEKNYVPVGIDGGEVGFALRSNPSHSGDKGDGGVNTTLVAATFRSGSNSKEAHGARAGDKDENIVAEVSPTLRVQQRNNSNPVTEADMLVAHSLKADGFDASEDGTGRGTPIVAQPAHGKSKAEKIFRFQRTDRFVEDSIASTLAARDFKDARDLVTEMAVRRLTPRECERLQGFPDDFTLIPVKEVRRERLNSPRAARNYVDLGGKVFQLSADGPRYKALGNSMAVPVIRWICSRMDLVDELVPLPVAPAGHCKK
jgi:DNA (cytosine-5)-methyltransferase 1